LASSQNAEVVDFWARYRGDQWLDHDGEGYLVSDNARPHPDPGSATNEDASLLVATDEGWSPAPTPVGTPIGPLGGSSLADDQTALEVSRLGSWPGADFVVPGHGPAFRDWRGRRPGA
jgi:hypothetical protein